MSRSFNTYYRPAAADNDPKRRASRRPAKLPGPVVDAFCRRRASQEALMERLVSLWKGPDLEEGYMFMTTVRTNERDDNVLAWSLKPLMLEARLPEHNFQTLQRSNATFLVLLGIHPRMAQRWMGHGDITTMKHYSPAPDELQEKAAELIGELLFGGETPPESDP